MSRLMVFLAAAAIALATPVSAKVLTVCGGLPGLEAELPAARPFATFAYAGSGAFIRPARIALTEGTAGYDIHLNWGEANERSLREAGAQILSMGLDVGIVHLMVARSEASPVEHYLFQLDTAGRGELLSGQDSDDLEGGLARFSCNAP